MRTVIAPPSVSLMYSMRSVGYTFEASVADLIDNSISAGADHVSVLTGVEPTPFIAFLDDGFGMDQETLVRAMTLGTSDPTVARGTSDLGRFGLGLKTASLAHARCLTVVTKTESGTLCARWDLDTLASRGVWELELLSEEDIERVPRATSLKDLKSGTLVVWTKLDQLEAAVGNFHAGLDAALATLRDHLGLVFHRFLNGDASRVALDINGNPVEGADPFLADHRKTIKGPPEMILVEGQQVTFQAFTLPVPSALSNQERDRARARNGLRDTQGFYIYRNKRLVVAGSWFELRPKQELDKLTRVRMDIPNTLDHLWQLDIKKSTARPPHVVRQKVKHLMDRTTKPSRAAIQFRGRKTAQDPIQRAWDLIQDRETFRYQINRQHPLVRDWLGSTSNSENGELLLRLLEESAPWEDAYARHADDQVVNRQEFDHSQLVHQAKQLGIALAITDADQLHEILRTIEPFSALGAAQIQQLSKEALRD